VLRYLVEQRGRLCPRTEILDAVWGDQFVSDSALASRVAAARAAIGDNGRAQRLIRTVHGRGLQFIAPVTEHPPVVPGPLLPEAPKPTQNIRFCTAADGHRLAVATVGDGRPLVKAANWLTHVEYDWDSPVWRHWMNGFAERFRFIRYDARGCGLSGTDLSTSDLTDLSLWTSDLEAVIESTDVESCVLLGVSAGVGPAMDYARRHPERVSHLILYGGYARGMRRRGSEGAQFADLNERMIASAWGGTNPAFRSVFTTYFMPDATSEQMRWFNDLQTQTATPEAALALETAFYDRDNSDVAREVDVPTLVLHCRDDMATPYEEGVRLAGLVPGAEFVTLESRNHLLTADEPAWPVFLDHIDRFTAT
jgi:pimeloyl-ACP methyl ester carboxylesterase